MIADPETREPGWEGNKQTRDGSLRDSQKLYIFTSEITLRNDLRYFKKTIKTKKKEKKGRCKI